MFPLHLLPVLGLAASEPCLGLILVPFAPEPVSMFFKPTHERMCLQVVLGLVPASGWLGSIRLAHTLPRRELQDALFCCLHRMVAPRNETAEFGLSHSQLIA